MFRNNRELVLTVIWVVLMMILLIFIMASCTEEPECPVVCYKQEYIKGEYDNNGDYIEGHWITEAECRDR